MQALPHRYYVCASAESEGDVTLKSDGLSNISSDAPAEFGGPGDKWSPETLLMAAVADCFVLSFKSVAKAAKFDWLALDCRAEGKLDKQERKVCFTEFEVFVSLTVAADVDEEQATQLLEKAERNCLVANSLSGPSQLYIEILRG